MWWRVMARLTPFQVTSMGGLALLRNLGRVRTPTVLHPPSTWTPLTASATEEAAAGAAEDKGKESSSAVSAKRKRAMITDPEAIVFNGMTDAMKEMADAIEETIHAKAHPKMYDSVMTFLGFTKDALLFALGWLYYNKAQSIAFV